MQDDAPAALPLLAFVTGLLFATNAIAFATMALLTWRFHRRLAIALAFLALGALRASSMANAPATTTDRFVTIEAPIESDWSTHDRVHVLRSTHFSIGIERFDAPLNIYARFEPPRISCERFIVAEGILRALDDRRYAITVKSPRLLSYRGEISLWSPSTWNRLAQRRLETYASPNPDEIAMIEALVLGRGERLSDDAKQNFRRGGTYHLLVFSGLQIALAAAVIAFAFRFAGAPRASDWSLLVFALLAPAFIGPTASVSRSSTGIALYALSRILKRPTSFENLWCVAALAQLILIPAGLTDAAFQLTYAGAGALIFIGKPLRKQLRWFAYAIAAEIVITPLTLFHFHQFALGGSLMTVVLTPVIFVMLVAGALFCITLFTPLLHVIAVLNAICTFINDLASPLYGFFAAPAATALAVTLVACLVCIAALRNVRRAVANAALFLIATSAAIARHVVSRTVANPTATFLDVGQGDSILLRSGAKNVLVDGGGRSEDPHFGEQTLLPLLVDRGVRRVDIVILSHAHPDHCGGLPAVIDQLNVGEVWINPRRFRAECAQTMLAAIARRQTRVRLIRDSANANARRVHSSRVHRSACDPPRVGEQQLDCCGRHCAESIDASHRRHRTRSRVRARGANHARRCSESRASRQPQLIDDTASRRGDASHCDHFMRREQLVRASARISDDRTS